MFPSLEDASEIAKENFEGFNDVYAFQGWIWQPLYKDLELELEGITIALVP